MTSIDASVRSVGTGAVTRVDSAVERTFGMMRATAAPRTARPAKVARHPLTVATAVPIGEPTASATAKPSPVNAKARPRRSSGTKVGVTANAVGTKAAAPTAATTRPATNQAKVGPSAVTSVPTEMTNMPAVMTVTRDDRCEDFRHRRRDQRDHDRVGGERITDRHHRNVD